MDHDDMQSWTSQEDDRLREALILNKKGTKNWREVATHVGTKTAHQCQQRWKNTLNPDVLRIKGRWTTEEDTRLAELVKRHGTKKLEIHCIASAWAFAEAVSWALVQPIGSTHQKRWFDFRRVGGGEACARGIWKSLGGDCKAGSRPYCQPHQESVEYYVA